MPQLSSTRRTPTLFALIAVVCVNSAFAACGRDAANADSTARASSSATPSRTPTYVALATLHHKVLAVGAFWENPKVKPNHGHPPVNRIGQRLSVRRQSDSHLGVVRSNGMAA